MFTLEETSKTKSINYDVFRIKNIEESGVLKQWIRVLWPQGDKCRNQTVAAHAHQLGVLDVQGLFYLTGILMTAAFVVLAFEFILKCTRNACNLNST